MTGAGPLIELLQGGLWAGFVVFIRIGAAMAVLPGLGESWLSVRIRLIIGLLLTVIVLPAVAPVIELPEPTIGTLARAVATESVAGLMLGLFLRFFLLAIQTAGSIAAQSTSLAQLMGNAGVDPLPAIGHILSVSALALLMATGFHVKAAMFFVVTYDLLPALEFPDPASVAEAGRERVSAAFSLAFTLAAPFVILSMLYNLTLGVINKAMPQLMVAFVGAPVITLGAIALLMLCAPLMLSVWLGAVDGFLSNPLR